LYWTNRAMALHGRTSMNGHNVMESLDSSLVSPFAHTVNISEDKK